MNFALKFLLCLDMILKPLFHTDCSISDSLKSVRKSVLIYETIINDIQGISVRVIAAVNQLMTNAQDLMNFIQNQIMNDYVEFEAATDMYYEKADHMDTITGLFNKNIMSLRNIMAEMNDGITNISAVVEENVRGVSNATENVTKLANSILNIHEQVIKNVDSSKYLLEELNSFQQI